MGLYRLCIGGVSEHPVVVARRAGDYIALTKADSGCGIIAGLSVAIIADRILSASARHARARLGLE